MRSVVIWFSWRELAAQQNGPHPFSGARMIIPGPGAAKMEKQLDCKVRSSHPFLRGEHHLIVCRNTLWRETWLNMCFHPHTRTMEVSGGRGIHFAGNTSDACARV